MSQTEALLAGWAILLIIVMVIAVLVRRGRG